MGFGNGMDKMVIIFIFFLWFFLILFVVYKKQVNELFFIVGRTIILILQLTLNKYVQIPYLECLNEYIKAGFFTILEVFTAIVIGNYINRNLRCK